MNTENQWGENHVPLRLNEVKINWPQNHMFLLYSAKYTLYSQSLCCASGLRQPKEEKEKGMQCLIHEKDNRKHWNIGERRNVIWAKRLWESFSAAVFSFYIHVGVLFILSLQLLCTAWTKDSVQSSFAPVKDGFGRLAAPTYLSPPTRQRCSEGIRSTQSWVAENLGVRAGRYYAEGSRDKQGILCPREWWQWELGAVPLGPKSGKEEGTKLSWNPPPVQVCRHLA